MSEMRIGGSSFSLKEVFSRLRCETCGKEATVVDWEIKTITVNTYRTPLFTSNNIGLEEQTLSLSIAMVSGSCDFCLHPYCDTCIPVSCELRLRLTAETVAMLYSKETALLPDNGQRKIDF